MAARPITKLLIANRGEIACRIMDTAEAMGIRTVAVYSEADAAALHAMSADEAYPIGPAPAAESYLVAEKILAVAQDAGADAIHPGYGFLSENAAFAEACAAADITFVGPTPEAIRAMGLKDKAKALMEKAGVPVVPGYHGKAQDLKTLKSAAEKIGYPVLIKAVAGGGGKGMRLVSDAGALKDSLAAARREAKAAFGDDRVLIEKFIEKPRHIEVQVFGDAHGNVVHLFERDCSLQRRHQKVIEEAPAPGMDPALREKMCAAAVAAARAVDYRSAGTIEFIVDAREPLGPETPFYFMEMNTRLQVEHPVTEMVTGQDLVEWQLRVAAGEALPLSQDEIALEGHAVEARLYAEDPDNDFLPAAGPLKVFRLSEDAADVRVDTGIVEGGEVSIHYDPMIAKIIAHGADRDDALERLSEALAGTRIAGTVTNLPFLAAVARHPAFVAGDVDTGFIARHSADLTAAPADGASDALMAALAIHGNQRRAGGRIQGLSADEPASPWNRQDGWRLNLVYREDIRLVRDGTEHVVTATAEGGHWRWALNGETCPDIWCRADDDGELMAFIDGEDVQCGFLVEDGAVTIMHDARTRAFKIVSQTGEADEAAEGPGDLVAPMPGKILKIVAKEGASVAAGDALIIMEAMKMEYTLAAPRSGTIGPVGVKVGEQVADGALLLTVAGEDG